MGTYEIDNFGLFSFVKDLGQPKILSMEGHQQHAILSKVYQCHGNHSIEESSFSITYVSSALDNSTENHIATQMGNLFPSPFM